MSIFAIHKFLFQLRNDEAFRNKVQADPHAILAEMPLSAAERAALERGDVRALYTMGVHAFLLLQLATHNLFGLNRANYFARIRGEQPAAPPPAPD